jgi:hypothetical protein
MADVDIDPRLFEHVGEGTPFEVVLRGHLWVEAQLISVLEEVLRFPGEVDLARFAFPQKVALVAAHGFIRPSDVAGYMKLNSLRNRLAHRAGDDPDEASADGLMQAFGSHLRSIIDPFRDDPQWEWSEWQSRLRLAVLTLYIALDAERDKYVAYRREVGAANRRLRQAAQRLVASASGGLDDGPSANR